ncbi:MAG: lysophospholipid acyltransferase family protein [Bdellovibrionota bacterium]
MFRARLFPKMLGVIAFVFYSLLRMTWRLRVVESASLERAIAENRPIVIAFWHGDELGVVQLGRRYRVAVITSTSKDGEIMNTAARLMGSKTSRGSSTRGGVTALKGIIRLAKEGYRPSVAVDGPKGPYHKVKPGVFEISKVTKAVIFPLAIAADRSFIFKKAWNKAFLPLPFARVVAQWGEPLPAVARDADAHDEKLALDLERALLAAGQQARNLIATY